jgi:hypothetical protein
VEQVAQDIHTFNELSSIFEASLLETNTIITNEGSIKLVQLLQVAYATCSIIEDVANSLHMLKLALNHARSHSLMFIFYWHTFVGHKLASAIVEKGLQDDLPLFVPLANHIKKEVTQLSGMKGNNLSIPIHSNVYPIHGVGKSTFNIPFFGCTVSQDEHNQTKHYIWFFINSISMMTASIAMKCKPVSLPTLNKLVVQGAVLDALHEGMDNNSILYLEEVQEALKSSAQLFGQKQKEAPLVRNLTEDPDKVLGPLCKWAYMHPDIASIQDASHLLGTLLSKCLVLTKNPKLHCAGVRHLGQQQKAKKPLCISGPLVALDILLAWLFSLVDMPQFGQLLLVLYEVILWKNGSPCFDEHLHWLLEGNDPFLSTFSKYNFDHFDPV